MYKVPLILLINKISTTKLNFENLYDHEQLNQIQIHVYIVFGTTRTPYYLQVTVLFKY